MAVVVSFTDYRPTPRYDEKAWTRVRIEESLVAPAVWTPVETIILDPVEPDPARPLYRDLTTDAASEDAISFRLVFIDAIGTELPTSPVPAVSPEVRVWRPTVMDVAALTRTRTKGEFGDEPGTFNETTRPTGDQVERIIDQAVVDVLGVFTASDVPAEVQEEAKRVAALRACLYVELSYFPEQGADNSPYLQLRNLADAAMQQLVHLAIALDGFEESPRPVDLLP